VLDLLLVALLPSGMPSAIQGFLLIRVVSSMERLHSEQLLGVKDQGQKRCMQQLQKPVKPAME
jgi:hypothetical protein